LEHIHQLKKLEILDGSIFIHGSLTGHGRLIMKKDNGGNQFEWYPQDDGLHLYNRTTQKHDFMILNNGNIGIGTAYPTSKLTVAGDIYCREVKVDLEAGRGRDIVFEGDFPLKSIEEVEAFIKKNKHLPDIPSAKEMEKNGVELFEMNMDLLQKIEELTLYLIEQNKDGKRLKTEVGRQKTEVKELKEQNKAQSEKVKELEEENELLKSTLSELMKRIEKLETSNN
jgi:hypothetical protein